MRQGLEDAIRDTLAGILKDLLSKTRASRTTLRLELADVGIHVNDVVAEALAPGVLSLKGVTSVNQWDAPTVQFMQREHSGLVQNDLRTADPQPPRELVEQYGATAQMLAPIISEGRLTGWVSVHANDGPREWRDADVDALEGAVRAVHRVLAAD